MATSSSLGRTTITGASVVGAIVVVNVVFVGKVSVVAVGSNGGIVTATDDTGMLGKMVDDSLGGKVVGPVVGPVVVGTEVVLTGAAVDAPAVGVSVTAITSNEADGSFA